MKSVIFEVQRLGNLADSDPRLQEVNILWTIFTSCPVLREEQQMAQEIARHALEKISGQLQICRVTWEDINGPLFTKYGIGIR